jgi:membrane protein implicated in regulation of membrane protease activity
VLSAEALLLVSGSTESELPHEEIAMFTAIFAIVGAIVGVIGMSFYAQPAYVSAIIVVLAIVGGAVIDQWRKPSRDPR